MIELRDRVEFPPDIELAGDRLQDLALGQSFPLSGSAAMYLHLLRAGRPMTEIVAAVAERFRLEPKEVERDLLGLVFRLNAAQLVNVRPVNVLSRLRQALFVVTYVALTRQWPPVLRRWHPIAGVSPVAIIGSVARVVMVHQAALWLLPAALLTLLGALTEPALIAPLLAVELGLMAAIVAHESGHALAARRSGVGCFLMTSAWKVAVVHPATGAAGWVHAGGALLAGLCGLPILVTAAGLDVGVLAVGALPFVVQLATLTVLTKDGRSLARSMGRRA